MMPILWVLFLLQIFIQIIIQCHAEVDCCPRPDFQGRLICEQQKRSTGFSKQRKTSPTTPVQQPGTSGTQRALAADLVSIVTDPVQCMTSTCVCQKSGGTTAPNGECTPPGSTKPMKKAVRMEYRCMSDTQRRNFNKVLNDLKTQGIYDQYSAMHAQAAYDGNAHGGPAFCPWHREYLKRLEVKIRMVDQDLFMPYWDSTIENNIPPDCRKDSMLFTPDFIGSNDEDGNVVDGPFANWKPTSGGDHITRSIGRWPTLISEDAIAWTMNETSIYDILSFTSPPLDCPYDGSDSRIIENMHGYPHVFMGGLMLDPATSSNDPCFFLHHSFVDCMWEMWRQWRQDPSKRQTDYPLDNAACCSQLHFAGSSMSPFSPLINSDGLNDGYTNDMYEYDVRPYCYKGDENPCCNSPYLWCDESKPSGPNGDIYQCAAKIRPGGNCAGIKNTTECCYQGKCINGVCVQTQAPAPTTPAPITSESNSISQEQASARIAAASQTPCYNEHECCSVWASQGQCSVNAAYMDNWCKPSCGKCVPSFNTSDQCSDRAPNCDDLAKHGNCTDDSTKFWMAENCRFSCNRCNVSRTQVCTGGEGSNSTVSQTPPGANCSLTDCYNQDMCCQVWSPQCSSLDSSSSTSSSSSGSPNSTLLKCICPISCSRCTPTNYNYGTCNDYHPTCKTWSDNGECQKNAWMLENCRTSCQSCLTDERRREICSSRQVPIARIRRSILQMADSDLASDDVDAILKGFVKFPESRGMPGVGVYKY